MSMKNNPLFLISEKERLSNNINLFDFLPTLKEGDSFCKTVKPDRENVPSCIGISIMSHTTLTARPFSYS